MSERAAVKVPKKAASRIIYLPHGILEPYSDMELKLEAIMAQKKSAITGQSLTYSFSERDGFSRIILLVSVS